MNEITKIPAYKYDGYLWYSNEYRPRIIEEGQYIERKNEDEEVFTGKQFAPSDVESAKHPFIVEGALFAKDENMSITIRCLDGKYYINQFNLNDYSGANAINHEWFVAKDKRRKALMQEIWTLQDDKSIFLESAESKERLLCAGMASYQPTFWVFKGFNKIDNNK